MHDPSKPVNPVGEVPELPKPLPVAAPGDWKSRVERVAFVLEHFTQGEKMLLYRMLHEGEGVGKMTRYARNKIEKDEAKSCSNL